MKEKKSKFIALDKEEFYLLKRCSEFTMILFGKAAEIHIDLAHILSEYVALNLAINKCDEVLDNNFNVIYKLKDEYFETSIRSIKVVLSHMSRVKYPSVVKKLYNLKLKIQKEGK